jgi:hypothetical protein
MIEEVLDALSVPAGPEDTRSLAQRRAALVQGTRLARPPPDTETRRTTPHPRRRLTRVPGTSPDIRALIPIVTA